MSKNISKFHYDRYMDGTKIMIGDRVAFRTNDDADNHDLGYVVAVFFPDTKEAFDWSVPSGGFLVVMDNDGLKAFPEAKDKMRLIARGDDQDVARAQVFMQGLQHAEDDSSSRYDRYFTGDEIRLGDVVQNGKDQGIIEFFIAPHSSYALGFSAPNGGVMFLSFSGGRELYHTTDDDEGFTLIRRFDETVVTEFEKRGLLCNLTYADGVQVAVDDEIEYVDSEGNSILALVIAVCHPFTQSAWDEKIPTGGFRVRFSDGDVALFGQMRHSIRLLKRKSK